MKSVNKVEMEDLSFNTVCGLSFNYFVYSYV